MSVRAYHHGNLRAELLEAAGRTLRERGVAEISLRELARVAGVSKSAPHRHFADRHALLEALAIDGFEGMAQAMEHAIAAAGDSYGAQLQGVGEAYVRFAVESPALLELMFSLAKAPGASPALAQAAEQSYASLGAFIARGQAGGQLQTGDPERLRLLIIATLQGIATLVSSGRVPAAQAEPLIGDAVRMFLARAPAAR